MKLILTIFLLSVIYISCDNTVSSFSQEYKDNFISACVNSAKVSLSNFEAERSCNCALDIIMTKYDSSSEADKKISNMSENDILELISPCY